MKKDKSVLKLIILQILIVGSFIPLSKYIYNSGVDPLNFSYQILLLASVFLSIYALASDKTKLVQLNKKHVLYMIAIGIIGSGAAHSD